MMFDLIPDAILRLDAERRVVECNAAVTGLTGWATAKLVGQPLAVLEPRTRDGEPVLVSGWPHASELRSVRLVPEMELTLRRADGNDVHAYATARYLRGDDDAVQGAVVSLRSAEARRHRLATGIEIIGTVSHELRSPLTSVKGYTSLLLSRWDRIRDDQKLMMLEQVHRDADRVTRLITELLDISRLESGRLVLHRRMVDLEALSQAVVDKMRMEYPELGCSVVFPKPFPEIYADPDKIEQILTNLVENACKYASPLAMVIQGETGDNAVAVAVHDRGEGFPERDLAKVFTKFFRRTDTRPTGSGLGLWISRGLAEAHGGTLVATSTIGHGSTFRFTLPLVDFEELHA
ncbi:MAG: ATP-binding protein [Acidimicrobiales bacterium]